MQINAYTSKRGPPSAPHPPIDIHRKTGISVCSEKSFVKLVLMEAETSYFLTSVNMQHYKYERMLN
jgi:hypothetical protein